MASISLRSVQKAYGDHALVIRDVDTFIAGKDLGYPSTRRSVRSSVGLVQFTCNSLQLLEKGHHLVALLWSSMRNMERVLTPQPRVALAFFAIGPNSSGRHREAAAQL